MSSIITNTILTNYPVAGVDNDSQGFRDNFTRIQSALAQAKVELINFENRAMLKTPLSGTGTATNDLSNGIIINGNYNKFYGITHSDTLPNTISNVNISLWDGIYQLLSMTVHTTINFTHWPDAGQYANIRLQITAGSSTPITLNLADITSENNGFVSFEAAFVPLTITSTTYHVIDAWSTNQGETVFVRYVGRFNKQS